MSDRFDELVDHPALRAEERERLRRVHDLLLEVGPPPDAPPHLRPPEVGVVVPFPQRRRVATLLAAALALAAAGGAGYLAGERASEEAAAPQPVTATTTVVTTVTTATELPSGPSRSLIGVGEGSGARATVEILPRKPNGEYPVRIRLRGLQFDHRETLELWIVKDGELEDLCGSFTTSYGPTEEVINVPYEMRTRDEWVIVRAGTTEPLLRT